jgi:hypothetical protein
VAGEMQLETEVVAELSPEMELRLLKLRLRVNEANVKLALLYARDLAAVHLPQPRVKELEDEYETEICEIQAGIDRVLAELK